MSDFTSLDAYMERRRARVEGRLEGWLGREYGASPRLCDAMRYVALGGGKRLRAILVHAACDLAGGTPEQADLPAAAIELVHAYSLVHDDLPAMDDDELRRGKATCHLAYDEATAILAGDTLHTRAFELLAGAGQATDGTRVRMIRLLAEAAGADGMAAGQMQDIESSGDEMTLEALEEIHWLKTGRLITAALLLGHAAAESSDGMLAQLLEEYGRLMGLAFQIRDDILDVVGEREALGKAGGSDRRLEKTTFPELIGLEASRDRAAGLCDRACELLADYGESAGILRDLARYIVARAH